MSWIAFLDILGSKHIAKSDGTPASLTFDERLTKFQNAIGQRARKSASIHARFFSDSAYISSPDIDSASNFLQNVAYNLVKESIYVKAVLRPGKQKTFGGVKALARKAELTVTALLGLVSVEMPSPHSKSRRDLSVLGASH